MRKDIYKIRMTDKGEWVIYGTLGKRLYANCTREQAVRWYKDEAMQNVVMHRGEQK